PVACKDAPELIVVEFRQGGLLFRWRDFHLPRSLVELGQRARGDGEVKRLGRLILEHREKITLNGAASRDGEARALRGELAGQQRVDGLKADVRQIFAWP